jgi:hypothetical protein
MNTRFTYPLFLSIVILFNIISIVVVLLSLKSKRFIIFPHFLFRSTLLFRFDLVNFTFYYLTLFSKFYFNFPSQYLFAIGLTVIFSVTSHLPRIIIFTQQSQAVLLLRKKQANNTPITISYETFTLYSAAFQQTLIS